MQQLWILADISFKSNNMDFNVVLLMWKQLFTYGVLESFRWIVSNALNWHLL